MKRAFTLVELLVVIAIIGVLAGIAIPVIGMVRKQAKDVQCRNNLKQLFTGITGYRMENNQLFPPDLQSLFAKGESLASENTKIIWCAHDSTHNLSGNFNRNPAWSSGPLSLPTGTSYMFELANVALGLTETTQWGWPPGTWMDQKIQQKRTGLNGGPYGDSDFPIIRCFYHHDWSQATYNDRTKKVLNLAWDGTLFLSVPEWENP